MGDEGIVRPEHLLQNYIEVRYNGGISYVCGQSLHLIIVTVRWSIVDVSGNHLTVGLLNDRRVVPQKFEVGELGTGTQVVYVPFGQCLQGNGTVSDRIPLSIRGDPTVVFTSPSIGVILCSAFG